MLTRIKGAHIVDPANGHDEIGDLWIRDDAIVADPQDGAQADETVDASGLIAMAGGIDIHSHIAGANVNTARLMLPEHHRAHARRPAGLGERRESSRSMRAKDSIRESAERPHCGRASRGRS